MAFDQYAKYYNLLYADKNYEREVDYIDALIQKFSKKKAKTILDFGCGTGTHASYLSKKGYKLSGVDLSQKMIEEAIKKSSPCTEFFVQNIATTFNLSKQFDIITCLFHVLSYQTQNEQIQQMTTNVMNHLTEDGLFIFDFWYAPAVLAERPSVRVKRFEDDEVKITRIAEPVLKVNENVVDVNFELFIEEKTTQELTKIKELHPMRYFSLPEVEQVLEFAGMKLLYAKEWMTESTPSDKTWGVCCVATKK
jgi:Predicted methyltransferase (contains TPR repeat)